MNLVPVLFVKEVAEKDEAEETLADAVVDDDYESRIEVDHEIETVVVDVVELFSVGDAIVGEFLTETELSILNPETCQRLKILLQNWTQLPHILGNLWNVNYAKRTK